MTTDNALPRTYAPQSVTYAFQLMLAGAALTGFSVVAALTQISSIRADIRNGVDGIVSESGIDMLVTMTVAFTVIYGAISIGLWIWMAYANRAGKNWARITGTVLFGLSTLSIAVTTFELISPDSDSVFVSPVISVVFEFLVWFVGLATVVLLWRRESGAYFKPAI